MASLVLYILWEQDGNQLARINKFMPPGRTCLGIYPEVDSLLSEGT